jgi:L-alanine-DL-glutamate epimerase-like enolase superfamily enzyme
MRLASLAFHSLPIPFRTSFDHVGAVRSCAQNIIVVAVDADGRVGLGEGCPRTYVTEESVESALMALREWHDQILEEIDSEEALDRWMLANAAAIERSPSAFCALELALLDVFARQCDRSLEGMLGLERSPRTIAATAVYGMGHWPKFLAQMAKFAANGMKDAKLKIGGNPSRDVKRAKILAVMGRVRLDANSFWPDGAHAIDGLLPAADHAWAVEEPAAVRDWAGMTQVARATGLAVIVDESFVCLEDIRNLPEGVNWILNVRVSKLGGLKRSLEALREAARRNLGVIIGAQVGETSILARAGLIVAAEAGERLFGYEGAYGTHLLKWDVVTPSIRFGRGGRISLAAAGLECVGAGLRPIETVLPLVAQRRTGVAVHPKVQP